MEFKFTLKEFSLRNAYLFSHGMGFFLFEKELEKKKDYFEVKIRKKDLNDVLGSIMVFTSSGKIASISYSSDIKETIKEKYLIKVNYFNYVITTMRGQEIKLTLKNQEETITGYLIGGESYNSSFKKKKNIIEQNLVLFQKLNQQLLQIPFSLIENLEIVDNEVLNELQKALETKAFQNEEEIVLKIYYETEANEQDIRAVIGYAIPIALWKINYRIKIAESMDEAFLDSFCIINNPLQEDWINTEISLITGRPIAFTYNLNRTDKLERSVINATNFSAIDPVVSEQEISFLKPSSSSSQVQSKMESIGEGNFNQELDNVSTSLVKHSDLNLLRYNLISTISKLLDSKKDTIKEQSMNDVLKEVLTSDNNFTRMNLGQDYQFHIKGIKTIKAKENAIIPLFKNLKVPCTKLLYLEYSGVNDSPYTSIELFNEADYPLENGPAVIFEENTPVGESILPTCFTSQSRIISYSKEPRVKIKRMKTSFEESIKTYDIINKPLAVLEKYTKYQIISFQIMSTLTESDKNPHLLVLDYKHPENWEIVKEDLKEVTYKILENGYRFSISLVNKTTFMITIKFKLDYSNEELLQAISKSYYSLFKDSISANDIKIKFEEHFRLRDELEMFNKQLNNLQVEKQSKESMIARIRNNLKAIPDISVNKVRNNFVIKLNKYEDDLDRIDKESKTIREQIAKINSQMEVLL